MNKNTLGKQVLVGTTVTIFTAITVVGISKINSMPKYSNTIKMITTSKTETLTELYFENHLSLPKYINETDPYTFTFTIHNIENKDMEYKYKIHKISEGNDTILLENKIKIANDAFHSITETVGPFDNIRTKIAVELPDQNQSISFWMEKI